MGEGFSRLANSVGSRADCPGRVRGSRELILQREGLSLLANSVVSPADCPGVESGARGSSFCRERDSPARKLLRDAALTSREQRPILAELFAGRKVHLCAEIVQYPGVLTSSHKGDKNSILSYAYVFIEIKARVVFFHARLPCLFSADEYPHHVLALDLEDLQMISDRSIPIDSLLYFERHRGNEVHVFRVMSN